MEACVGAHHLSRKLQMLGHDARLMPAKYVRPYSKGQKNDFRDRSALGHDGLWIFANWILTDRILANRGLANRRRRRRRLLARQIGGGGSAQHGQRCSRYG
jgi:transposase